MKKSNILILALATLLIFPAIGYLIFYIFSSQSIQEVLIMNQDWYLQSVIGILYGTIAAFGALLIFRIKIIKPELEKYKELIRGMNLKLGDVIFISFCAGIGEELLFRAAVQPLLGLIITSVLFVALHGYLNPLNLRISIYGLYLTVVILGIAYLYCYSGIICAIWAHTVIDIILLYYLTKNT